MRRMFARAITIQAVESALGEGKVIQHYPQDKPYPSYLLLAESNNQPLHIVVARNKADNHCYVTTAYIPSSKIWLPGFKQRKPS